MTLLTADLKLARFFPLLWSICFYGNRMNGTAGDMLIECCINHFLLLNHGFTLETIADHNRFVVVTVTGNFYLHS